MWKPFFLNAKRHLPHTHSCYRTSEEILVHQFIRVLAITGLNQLRSIGRNQNLVTLFSSKGLTLLKERYFVLPLLNGTRQMGPYNAFLFVSFPSSLLVVSIFGYQWLSLRMIKQIYDWVVRLSIDTVERGA